MLVALEVLAVFCAALFAGAALYITLVEHPARMQLATRLAVAQWAPSYERATTMQAPLALVSCAAGIAAWLVGAGTGWLVAAGLQGLVVPYTLAIVMPTNHQLQAPGRDPDAAETRALLIRWGQLHVVRTGLSLVATVLYLCLLAGT